MANHGKDLERGHNAVRPQITESNPTNSTNSSGERRKIGAQIRQDTAPYERLYPDMKLAKITNENGELDRWLEAGGKLVKRMTAGATVYEGINDAGANQWARWVAGVGPDGSVSYTYLVMMSPEDYDYYKNAPDRERQADIAAAMYGGKAESESFTGGGQVKSYAASLPDGSGVGYNRIKSN